MRTAPLVPRAKRRLIHSSVQVSEEVIVAFGIVVLCHLFQVRTAWTPGPRDTLASEGTTAYAVRWQKHIANLGRVIVRI